jgi:cytochrome c oxidase cbb3-type subunit 2
VRSNSSDVDAWGAASEARKVAKESPVLIGNRRQGPDLSHVGGRRSAVWLHLHFRDPRALAPDSTMPSYAHLLDDGRLDDLIAFLRANAADDGAEVVRRAAAWRPALSEATDPQRGAHLFERHCAPCHGPAGRGDGPLAAQFAMHPANLLDGPLTWSQPRPDESRAVTLARIICFGLPGTDMPGHETCAVKDVAALAKWVERCRN